MSSVPAFRRLATITSALKPVGARKVPSVLAVSTAGTSGSSSVFSHINPAPLDPILGTSILFNNDKDPRKINLGIGAYRTDEGKPYVLNVVRKAEKLVMADPSRNMEYLPQQGDTVFSKAARELLFGSKSAALSRIASVQTISGTGSLRVAAAFLRFFFPKTLVYYSNPTWGNHVTILQHADVPGKAYRYWNDKAKKLDINGMIEDLRNAPPRSVILLHACAHNPTGVDPTESEWKQICEAVRERNHLVWFDSAYQGFASGDLERDAWAIRYFVEQGLELIASQSFAKNFGLYGERIGAFHVVSADPKKVDDLISQINIIIRALYSNPPKHGAAIVKTVLTSPELFDEWKQELRIMSHRIIQMRQALVDQLKKLGTPGDWSHITSQIGMFSFTGLTPPQCETLVKKHHIYLLTSGRISMTGINTKNVAYLAQSIDDVVRNIK